MNTNLVAMAFMIYSGYLLYTGQTTDGNTPKDLMQAAIAGLGGASFLVYNNLEYIKNIFPKKKKSGRISKPAGFENKDLECLIHLRDRCVEAGSQEGFDVCSKLNEIVFKLNLKIKEDKKKEN